MIAPKESAKSKIEKLLAKQPQKWLTTSEIAESLPEISRAMMYFTMSQLSSKEKRLARRKRAGSIGFEYQIANQPAPVEQTPAIAAEQPSAPDTSDNTMKLRFKEAIAKIMWTEEEKFLIARSFMTIGKERPFLSTSERIRLSQKNLPTERQRKFVVRKKDIPWLDQCISILKEKDAKEQAEKLKLKQSESEIPTDQDNRDHETYQMSPAIAESVKQVTDEVAQNLTDEPVQESLQLDLSSIITSEILGEVMKRATAALTKIVVDVFKSPQVQEALTIKVNVNVNPRVQPPPIPVAEEKRTHEDRRQDYHPRHDPSVPTVEKPRLKKILIAGLINPQIREIEREFHDTLDIRFWRTDENPNVLKSKAGQADKVILVTDFISHSHQGIIQNMNIKFIRHSGGMTKLKDLLTEIYIDDKK